MLSKKNGLFFARTVKRESFVSSVWDPYFYRQNGLKKKLQDYADVTKPLSNRELESLLFGPIEYRHIPRGDYLTFRIEPRSNHDTRWPSVGEQQLLFGTMRAYLGNVVATPKAEWLGLNPPLFFGVKSEFLQITPKDSYLYFWWAYLRSSAFLRNLPLGGGGTRPRLHKDGLLATPVSVPDADKRKSIHQKLEDYAEREWKESIGKAEILRSINSTKNMNARHLQSRTRQAQR
jgi:hypothetical protein